ncbi:hypothetical protein AbraIFM66951_000056 [Aspergillus brasiliensis]|uniref:Heterokaryon incompatibility domain-containing protein n=1 Tax=Aspergillus brasiliensis TaxID=319629 RepID=A0A9W5YIS0_9EURO|nr:hypothetical protein AbraCBS73388_000290 [Aspergillus brasiliensis]GKZ40295.1 hypothetical protein AbraIFM66951_000056 [Aspergillus brasiliensis]
MPDNDGQGDLDICKDVLVLAKLKIGIAKGAGIPDEDTHLLEYFSRDELPADLRSEMCLSLAVGWLDKCCREHAKCDGFEDKLPFLPTRVIDVGDSLTPPHLHISADGETGNWVSLSYCWGGDSNFTLNASSFDDLRSGRSLATFPATLRDAVLVTRALGFRYLWIDTLCIFQDDTNDWAVEASRMSRTYRHAAVTIAATSAETVDDGFLDKRAPYFSCSFPWRRQCHQGDANNGSRAYSVVLRSYRDMEPSRYSRWATRGWTLQEELLSKRLLYYAKEEISWKCHTVAVREPEEEPSTEFQKNPGSQSVPLHVPDEESTTDSTAGPYMTWYQLLEDYASRDLTYDKDRLPAIGALAEFFHAKLKGQYCAGLWREDLLFGLLWSFHNGELYAGPYKEPLTTSTERSQVRSLGYQYIHNTERYAPMDVTPKQREPSWSWIGADTYAGLGWPSRWKDDYTFLARIGNVRAHGQVHNVFGHVEGAELTLDAPYRHVRLNLGSYSKSRWNPAGLAQRVLAPLSSLASTRELAQIALVRPGYLGNTETSGSVIVPSSSTNFTLIQVAEKRLFGASELYLLILQPQPGHATNSRGLHRYRRVGLLRLRAYEPYEGNHARRVVTRRLEGDAYNEVISKQWPVGTFVID